MIEAAPRVEDCKCNCHKMPDGFNPSTVCNRCYTAHGYTIRDWENVLSPEAKNWK